MEIKYQIKSSNKSRHVRIAVFPDGRVVVTKPMRVPRFLAENFVNRKKAWILKKVNFYKSRKTISLTENPISAAQALQIVKDRVAALNQHYNFIYNKVSLKNHKSLWGSCSRLKNLNFNSKIVQLPPEQMDYILVHELCHLQEMNHSANFWKLVAQTVPNFRQIRMELKSYSFY